MYTEIVNNEHYELGIVGALVCLRFKPAFDQVLGEDRGNGTLGGGGPVSVKSNTCPELGDGYIYLPGGKRDMDSRTITHRPDNPQEYAEQLHGALTEYIASKQPFKKGDRYWTIGFDIGGVAPVDLTWNNDEPGNRDLSLNIAFKTKEECERCIEETKEFWRSR